MHTVIVFAFGLIVGGALVWGFRGYIQHRKDAAKAAIGTGLGNVAKKF